MKKSKVYLKYSQQTGKYKVKKLVNKVEPYVGSELSEGQVKYLNSLHNVDVVITEEK